MDIIDTPKEFEEGMKNTINAFAKVLMERAGFLKEELTRIRESKIVSMIKRKQIEKARRIVELTIRLDECMWLARTFQSEALTIQAPKLEKEEEKKDVGSEQSKVE